MRIRALLFAGLTITACSRPLTSQIGPNNRAIQPTTTVKPTTIGSTPTTVGSASTTVVSAPTAEPTTSSTADHLVPAPASLPQVTFDNPTPGITGLMWESAVDNDRVNITNNQPRFSVGELTARVQSYIAVDTTAAPSESPNKAECDVVLAYGRENGVAGSADGRCLFVQIAFDVADRMPRDDRAYIRGATYVGPDGVAVDSARGDDGFAYSGTLGNLVVAQFAKVEPGGVVWLDVYGGVLETVALEIPAEMLPVNFD